MTVVVPPKSICRCPDELSDSRTSGADEVETCHSASAPDGCEIGPGPTLLASPEPVAANAKFPQYSMVIPPEMAGKLVSWHDRYQPCVLSPFPVCCQDADTGSPYIQPVFWLKLCKAL